MSSLEAVQAMLESEIRELGSGFEQEGVFDAAIDVAIDARQRALWPMNVHRSPARFQFPLSTVNDLKRRLQRLTRMIAELQSTVADVRIGVGAIHSLDNGRVQLRHPLFYGYQEFGDEVLVSIGDLGITGVGVTESEAVQEAQARLWAAYEHTRDMPVGSVGGQVVNIIRAVEWRIADALDA